MLTVKVNGKRHEFHGDPEMPILWFLRDEFDITGPKY